MKIGVFLPSFIFAGQQREHPEQLRAFAATRNGQRDQALPSPDHAARNPVC